MKVNAKVSLKKKLNKLYSPKENSVASENRAQMSTGVNILRNFGNPTMQGTQSLQLINHIGFPGPLPYDITAQS